MRPYHLISIASLLIVTLSSLPTINDQQIEKMTDTSFKLLISLQQAHNQALLEDSIVLSVDHPDITIKSWHQLHSGEAVAAKSPLFVILLENRSPEIPHNANVHVHYFLTNEKNPRHEIFPILENPENPSCQQVPNPDELRASPPDYLPPAQPAAESLAKRETSTQPVSPSARHTHITTWLKYLKSNVQMLIHTFFQHVKRPNTLWMQAIIGFIVGLCLALTPCINPLIPLIAVPISTLTGRLWLCALITIPCILVGVSATPSTYSYGSLTATPWLVCIIILTLLCLAGTLLGVYTLLLPPFIIFNGVLPGHTNLPKNTKSLFFYTLRLLISLLVIALVVYLCLSPGLVILLVILPEPRGTVGSILPFFTFGLGASLSLLLAHSKHHPQTLSTKQTCRIREKKKLCGLAVTALCFYYLPLLLPVTTVFIMAALTLGILGMYYAKKIKSSDPTTIRRFQYGMSILLIASAVVTMAQAIKREFAPLPSPVGSYRTK